MVRSRFLFAFAVLASLTAAAFETTVESPEIPVLLSNGRLTALVDDALAVPAELRIGEKTWPNAIVWEGRRMTAPGYRLIPHGRFRPHVTVGGKPLGEPVRRVQTFDTGRAETRIVRTFADGVTLEGAAFVAADENVIALRLEVKGAPSAEFDLAFEQPTDERIVASLSDGAYPRRFRMKSYGRTVTETAVDIVRLERGPCAADFLLVFADSLEKSKGTVEDRLAASVGRLSELGYEGLRAAHRAAWSRYYGEGSCVVPDERILRMREMAEYQLRCCVTEWSIPVGMVPNMWEGKIFAFDEMYAVQGLLSAGHLSSAARATDYRRATLRDAHARNGSWGWSNYRKGHSFGARWVWQAMEDDVTEGGRPGFWLDHLFHMATVARSAWLQYRFSNDLAYLRETSYPVLMECARYFRWNCLYENPSDGSLFFGKCTDLERLGPARERATLTTVGAIHTLRNAAEASGLLSTNATEAADLRACADRLERSLAVEDGRFLAFPGCAEESMGTLAGFFPFPIFPREHPVMRKTVEHFLAHGAKAGNMYAVGKQVCPWYAATMSVAAGMTGDRTAPLRWIDEAGRSAGEWGEYWEINEKGGARMRPWFMTAAANTLYAIDRLFVADADGEIRIAFHVPEDWRTFSFALPSEAGVTVRAEAKDGRLVRLELLGLRTSGPYRLRLRTEFLRDEFVRNFRILSRADEQGETVLTVECEGGK